jgi:excisionase family DNA binding protein
MSDTLKRYLSVKQICERLAVCKSLVYRLVREGEIPSTRLAGKILIPIDELQALLEAKNGDAPTVPPPSQPLPRRRKGKVDLW